MLTNPLIITYSPVKRPYQLGKKLYLFNATSPGRQGANPEKYPTQFDFSQYRWQDHWALKM